MTATSNPQRTVLVTGSVTPDEFRNMFDESYTPMVAYARRRTSTVADAEDLVADVFSVAWRRWDDRDPARATLPWLYGIAANVLRNQQRSSARHLRLVERIGAEPPKSIAEPAESYAIRDALEDLPFEDQELLRLIAWEGLSHAEVAEVLGCSSNAVGIRIHRARKRLKESLASDSQPDNYQS